MTALHPIPSNWSLQMAKSGHVMVIWPCCKLPVLAANMILHMRNMLYHFIILTRLKLCCNFVAIYLCSTC